MQTPFEIFEEYRSAVDFKALMNPDHGTVTITDNNSDGKYDVVIIESAKYTVFSSYDDYNEIIYDKFDLYK